MSPNENPQEVPHNDDPELKKFMKFVEEAAKKHHPIGSIVKMSDRKYVVRWDGAWVRMKS